jgi:crotonobetainyl-CoA:carnitine CoA-transferase CaiB-like acyl-CoA transferase
MTERRQALYGSVDFAGEAQGMQDTALEGIRICDLSGQLAGAGATRYLAAMGAEVIRVEDPVRRGRWDILRGFPPFKDGVPGIERGGGFHNHNVGKLGVTINLRLERGRELLRELIARSDVVTENFAAGVFARLGFSYEQLRTIRPDVIYVSNSGFGHSGPYREFKTWGPIVQAACGLTHLTGSPAREPCGIGFSYMDHHGGNFMAMAVLSALIHRERTGRGQWVDMSCVEAGATLTGPAFLDHSVNGRPTRRDGYPDSNHHVEREMAPHAVYPAAGEDEWVAIVCRDDADWRALGHVIGEPWACQERFSTLAGRVEHEVELDGLLGDWTAKRSKRDTERLCADAGVPAGIVARPEDRIEHDPRTRDWGLWPTVEHPVLGPTVVDGLPVHFSGADWSMQRGAPCLGEHNDRVFGELMGYSAEELDELRADGVL